MRKLLLNATFLVLFILFGGMAFAQKKPNVLFVLVDDLGYKDLSVDGSKIFQTPNVDKIADNAFRFENAYASYPRCVPSRFSMMTGTYPLEEDHGELSKIKESQSFVKQFDKAGYETFYVGKWHLGSGVDSPKGIGYTYSFAAGDAGGTESHFWPFNGDRVAGTQGEKAPIDDVKEYGKPGDYLADVLTTRTIQYINDSKDKPFMGVIAYYAVHTPLEGPKDLTDKNQQEINNFKFDTPEVFQEGPNATTKGRQDNPKYAAMVENMDYNFGRIIDALKKAGKLENTLIVFTSDHGGLSTKGRNNREIATSNYPYRAGKGWIYEGGIKVPLFFYYPSKIKKGIENQSIVMGMDIFPTIIDLVLDKKIEGIDGKSYKAVMQGKENWKDRTVYWNSYKARPGQTGDNKTSSIRVGDYKLLQFVETGKVELYNVKEDISEKNDLSSKMPEKTQEMLAQLEKFKKDRNVSMKENHRTIPGGTGDPMIDEAMDKKAQKKEARKAEKKAARKGKANDAGSDE